jgi:hypothetical protein
MVSGRGKNVLERRVEKKRQMSIVKSVRRAFRDPPPVARQVETLRCVREIPPEISPGSAGAA